MKYHQFKKYVRADIYRYAGNKKTNKWKLILCNAGLRYTVVMRLLRMTRSNAMLWPIFFVLRWYRARLSIKYGIDIPYHTSIGPGLYIGHYGGIIVNQEVVIGNNCNINHGVTLGVAYGGRYPGCPRIGHNVFFGAGCKVFGGIEIGDHAAVGANCVVTKPVPDSAVVVGVPGKVISYKGSGAYVIDTI